MPRIVATRTFCVRMAHEAPHDARRVEAFGPEDAVVVDLEGGCVALAPDGEIDVIVVDLEAGCAHRIIVTLGPGGVGTCD